MIDVEYQRRSVLELDDAHRDGSWFFTIVFPAMFALFWLSLILLTYGLIRIG